MRLFTATADNRVGGHFLDGNDAIINGFLLMIIIAAFDRAFFALTRANIKVDIKTQWVGACTHI
jgi:hypothetical protein